MQNASIFENTQQHPRHYNKIKQYHLNRNGHIVLKSSLSYIACVEKIKLKIGIS
jgi:hypothetical protein